MEAHVKVMCDAGNSDFTKLHNLILMKSNIYMRITLVQANCVSKKIKLKSLSIK